MEKQKEVNKPPYDPKAKRKVRADKYEEKVKFEGSLEDMINIAITTPPVKKTK